MLENMLNWILKLMFMPENIQIKLQILVRLPVQKKFKLFLLENII